MILTCTACATRYSVDGATFPPAGRQVRCAKCGNVWFQPGPADEPAAGEAVPGAAAAAPAPTRIPERIAESSPESARPRDFVARRAPKDEREAMGWRSRLVVVAGWAALIAVVVLIGLSAVRYRQEISTIWPQSAGVYNRLGMKVNVRGIDFVKVDYHRESEDGQVVLAVTGRIINNGNRELPVPQSVMVILTDAGNREIYHWPFTPSAQTLKPGQSVPFLTRLSSPPAAARHLEVRFAKDGS